MRQQAEDHVDFTEMLLQKLKDSLPAIFSRNAVEKLLGGAISPGTLANLGREGPEYAIINRNAVYEKETFLAWLRTRISKSKHS